MSTKIAIPSAPSGVSTFTFDGHVIRVVEIKGEPWFATKDVTATLGLAGSATNTSNHMRYLREDERAVLTKEDYFLYCPSLFTGSASRIAVISESGLYKLILRAGTSPTATAFQNWVTRDVLPTIRKSGAYVAGQEALAPAQQAEMAAMVADLVARMGVLLDREESRQKAEAARKTAVTTDFTTVREFLEGLGLSMSLTVNRRASLPPNRLPILTPSGRGAGPGPA